jgi:antitoxin HicB
MSDLPRLPEHSIAVIDRNSDVRYDGSTDMKKARFHFNIVLRPEAEGGFTAIVPALPGCVTYGHTLAEARKMAKDAIAGYIASLRNHGESILRAGETA